MLRDRDLFSVTAGSFPDTADGAIGGAARAGFGDRVTLKSVPGISDLAT